MKNIWSLLIYCIQYHACKTQVSSKAALWVRKITISATLETFMCLHTQCICITSCSHIYRKIIKYLTMALFWEELVIFKWLFWTCVFYYLFFFETSLFMLWLRLLRMQFLARMIHVLLLCLIFVLPSYLKVLKASSHLARKTRYDSPIGLS